jgi:N-acetylglucosamine-6-sulfatase
MMSRPGQVALTCLVCLSLFILVDSFLVHGARGFDLGSNRGKPNIILILTDDQRADSLGVMPNVRRLLAARGVTFTNAFTTTSLCCPSRTSTLTGQYSRHTDVLSNWPPDGGAPAFHDGSTVATWLHRAGYTTGLVGKYLNQYELLGRRYIPPGWDEWDVYASQPELNYYGGYTLNENGSLVRYGTLPVDYSTPVLTRKAVQFLRTAPQPFFLYFAPNAPHLPSLPLPREKGRLKAAAVSEPPSYDEADVSDKPWGGGVRPFTPSIDRWLLRLHRHMLESLLPVDRSVDQIVTALEERDALANTMIVFTSDNGYMLGEHRLAEKGWPYEESIRVPLIIRGPWGASAARTDSHLVLNIDLAPTFASLAGVRPGLREDGSSLIPLLANRGTRWRDAFVVEYLGRQWNGGPPRFEAIRTERYLYVEYRNGWRELYDFSADPYELVNLAQGPGALALRSGLAKQLHALLAS